MCPLANRTFAGPLSFRHRRGPNCFLRRVSSRMLLPIAMGSMSSMFTWISKYIHRFSIAATFSRLTVEMDGRAHWSCYGYVSLARNRQTALPGPNQESARSAHKTPGQPCAAGPRRSGWDRSLARSLLTAAASSGLRMSIATHTPLILAVRPARLDPRPLGRPSGRRGPGGLLSAPVGLQPDLHPHRARRRSAVSGSAMARCRANMIVAPIRIHLRL